MGHSLLCLTNNHSWPMFTFEKQGQKKKKIPVICTVLHR